MKEKLDIIFSKFIRLRDTDEYGYCNCFTCGGNFYYYNLECGHFRSRRHLGTRWYQENAHAQCRECNQKEDIGAMMIAMINRHGIETAEEIISISKKDFKFSKQDYEDMYHHYRNLVSELLEDKMFVINY